MSLLKPRKRLLNVNKIYTTLINRNDPELADMIMNFCIECGVISGSEYELIIQEYEDFRKQKEETNFYKLNKINNRRELFFMESSKKAGHCLRCKNNYQIGDAIWLNGNEHFHADCASVEEKQSNPFYMRWAFNKAKI